MSDELQSTSSDDEEDYDDVEDLKSPASHIFFETAVLKKPLRIIVIPQVCRLLDGFSGAIVG
jgi:hypothetical protein